jgi:hypothetical protein
MSCTVGIRLRDVRWSNKPMIKFEQQISVDQILASINYIVIRTTNLKSVDRIAKILIKGFLELRWSNNIRLTDIP